MAPELVINSSNSGTRCRRAVHPNTFLALVLRRELLDRLAAGGAGVPEWQFIIDDLLDLSAVEVDQDGRRALLRTAPRPSIDPICRALGLALPPVFQEVPTDKASISAD
jgi:hypothetical protein